MSKYENYDSTSPNYDNGRYSSGSDVAMGMLWSYLKKPLSEAHALDAGCGTGNYSKALLENGIRKLNMLDGSEGMLAQAKTKVASYMDSGRIVGIQQHFLPNLPFSENNFDIVMFMQVLHHVDQQSADSKAEYPNAIGSIREAYRVLKPGGVLMIDMHTQQQAKNGYWFYSLVPKAAVQFQKRVMPEEMMLSLLENTGFDNVSYITRPNSSLIKYNEYSKIDGPLHQEWRNMDSIWGLVNSDELSRVIDEVQAMKNEGTLQDYFEKNDQVRRKVGQSITVFAQKPHTVNGHRANGYR